MKGKTISMLVLVIILFMLCSCKNEVKAEEKAYTVNEMDVFTDLDGVKKIVTQVNTDGSFVANAVGDWLRSCNDYTVLELAYSNLYTRYYGTDSIVLYSYNRDKENNSSLYADLSVAISVSDVIRVNEKDKTLEIVSGIDDGNLFAEIVNASEYYDSYADHIEKANPDSLYGLRNWEADATKEKLQIGDICYMQTVEDISELEVVVQSYEDGSFDTEALGVWLDESDLYEKREIFSEAVLDWITFYYKTPVTGLPEISNVTAEDNNFAIAAGDIIRVYDSKVFSEYGTQQEVEMVLGTGDDGAIVTVKTVKDGLWGWEGET